MTKVMLAICLILGFGCAGNKTTDDEVVSSSVVSLKGLWDPVGIECYAAGISTPIATASNQLYQDGFSFHGNEYYWNLTETNKCQVQLTGNIDLGSDGIARIYRYVERVVVGSSCDTGAGDTCESTAPASCNIDDTISSTSISPLTISEVFTDGQNLGTINLKYSYDDSGILWLETAQTAGAGTTCYKRYDVYSWIN